MMPSETGGTGMGKNEKAGKFFGKPQTAEERKIALNSVLTKIEKDL